MKIFAVTLGLLVANAACACADGVRASDEIRGKVTACGPERSHPEKNAQAIYEQATKAEKAGRLPEALTLYRVAARGGEGAAAVRLSQLYDTGADGVSPDPHESIRWLLAARLLKHEVPGRSDGAILYEQGRRAERAGKGADALRHYLASARTGYAPAAARLSDIYDSGVPGVGIDYDAAARWRQTAHALNNLAPASAQR